MPTDRNGAQFLSVDRSIESKEIRSLFNEKELAYIRSQPLARLATVNEEGQPDVAAVAHGFDGEAFYVGGLVMTSSRTYKNADNAEPAVALIIAEMAFGVMLVGEPPVVGRSGPATMLKITPAISWSWSLEGPMFVDGKFITNRTAH